MQIVLNRLVEEPDIALVTGSAPVVVITLLPAVENGFVLALVIGTSESEGVLGPDQEGRPLTARFPESALQGIELRRRHADIHRTLANTQHVSHGSGQETVELRAQIVVLDSAIFLLLAALVGIGVVDVVRRVGEHHVSQLSGHQFLHVGRFGGTPAEKTMVTQYPEIARFADRFLLHFRHMVVFCLSANRFVIQQQAIELIEAKPHNFEVKVQIIQGLQLCFEQFIVPACILRQLVISQHQSPTLHLVQMPQHNHRHRRHTQLIGRHQTTMTCHNHPVLAHQNRIHKPEAADGVSNLGHLLRGVGTGVAGIGHQLGDRPLLKGFNDGLCGFWHGVLS